VGVDGSDDPSVKAESEPPPEPLPQPNNDISITKARTGIIVLNKRIIPPVIVQL
jgi:hypothetical protein